GNQFRRAVGRSAIHDQVLDIPRPAGGRHPDRLLTDGAQALGQVLRLVQGGGHDGERYLGHGRRSEAPAPRRRPSLSRMLADLYRYRVYILQTAAADVRHRYAGSTVGVFWNILQPLAMILIFSIVFGTVFKERGAGIDVPRGGFAIYLVSALL